mgnify:CR=1 FL=1
MKFEFNQGIPKGCFEWLWENVGEGNRVEFTIINVNDFDVSKPDWFYERVKHEIPSTDPTRDSNARYIPTIYIENEKKAVLFALRWT